MRRNLPLEIIRNYYEPGTDLYKMLMNHNRLVLERAIRIAKHLNGLNPDLQFIREAAMLHDIGIFLTETPKLCCSGKEPYIRHGVLGAELLDRHGLHRHALVCERHVGTGITAGDIRKNRLPLPERDMVPQTLEEEIIAYADKFYSKDCEAVVKYNSVADIVRNLERHGEEKVRIFLNWVERFEGDDAKP